MTKPYVIVAGFGRCGSSLVMQMLAATGIPCIGSHPDYEVPGKIELGPVDAEYLAAHPGHAFKLLGPHEAPLPKGIKAVAIWLDREPREQARSQAKFLAGFAGVPKPNRQEIRGLERTLRRDRPRALAALGDFPRINLYFEDIIERPLTSAVKICMFLAPCWLDLRPGDMSRIVKRRSSDCAPDLSIEAASIREPRQ